MKQTLKIKLLRSTVPLVEIALAGLRSTVPLVEIALGGLRSAVR